MVGPGIVLQSLLHELEPGYAHRVERRVIGAGHRARPERGNAQVHQRGNPLLKNGLHPKVLLHPYTTNATGAVVDVEVGGMLGMFGHERRAVGNVLLDIVARAQESLLFASPESNADGAAGLHT